MKPKPLDGIFKTKGLRKKVKREFRESFENGYTKFDDIVDTAVYLIKEKMREIKHRIKQACEFYLRYKDEPDLLIKEHPEFKEEVEKIVRKVPPKLREHDSEFIFFPDTVIQYNEWLFKLAFKDVLGGEE